ncbi:M48 family metallopeptidase [Sinimarinibacterium sp. NLF-5-8]|uniref:M48 family metallopeptidase n=1 Tax=Sinimarinibacterium sp. NLF-5-8 TaxID=2698684 RepID=UPI00137BD609|nr:SprT family zinc-dependent metalloprotease [Sinimarinibacterium sp. NLF-5-8]QHS10236.1 M48 family metallopeptidase [Sinimarinibacterium sp. NLF-5-8]
MSLFGPSEPDQLELFGRDYQLIERISTRARNVRIEVRPGREVRLIYPRFVARADALRFLQSREAWVRDKLEQLAARAPILPPAARWDGGDEILLYGAPVLVDVAPATLRQIQVRIEPSLVTVFVPPSQRDDAVRMARALKRALMDRAAREARQWLDAEATALGVTWRTLTMGDPISQWGSCSADGAITLSWRLLMAPPEVFRYVVIHELCHRLHMDHSDAFWACVAQRMPDFLLHRQWLRQHGNTLHAYLSGKRRR